MATDQIDYDIVIVGAGISGINSAHHIQTNFPHLSYTILEARHTFGGTWSLFQYPGIRSDSDLHTFGFQWRPWPERYAIAEGPAIIKYLKDCTEAEGIDKHIQYHHKVLAADWSSKTKCWSLDVEVNGEKRKTIRTRFAVLGTGYYNYDTPLDAEIPGINNFQGKVVHPQFWPKDLDYTDKEVVVIGSGATAITILPAMSDRAKHITMLQRSPSYILSLKSKHPDEDLIHNILPRSWALTIIRWKYIITSLTFFNFCHAFPNAARKMLAGITRKSIPKELEMDPDWIPRYNPWQQRMCISPDNDFYIALNKGKTSVVTGIIKNIDEKTITLTDGRQLSPDIIVTATGLRLALAGQAKFTVDGRAIEFNQHYLWKGMMLDSIPNAAFTIGYTNSSWTLGAEVMGATLVKIMKEMKRQNADVVVPIIPDEERKLMKPVAALNLTSTYLVRGAKAFPLNASRGPWRSRISYLGDLWDQWFGGVKDGLVYERGAGWLRG